MEMVFEKIVENPATLIIALVLSALVIAAIVKIRHDRKHGRGPCESGCEGCRFRDSCEKEH